MHSRAFQILEFGQLTEPETDANSCNLANLLELCCTPHGHATRPRTYAICMSRHPFNHQSLRRSVFFHLGTRFLLSHCAAKKTGGGGGYGGVCKVSNFRPACWRAPPWECVGVLDGGAVCLNTLSIATMPKQNERGGKNWQNAHLCRLRGMHRGKIIVLFNNDT